MLQPDSLTFPDTAAGGQSLPQNVNVVNDGAVPIFFTSSTDFGNENAFSTVESDCTDSPVLPPGGDCQIAVYFIPNVNGSFSGGTNVTINGSTTVSATWTGRTGPAKVTAVPAEVDFGELIAGSPLGSRTELIHFTSDGGESLEFGAPVLTGFDVDQFTIVSNDCTGSLAPGDACAVGVNLHPAADIGGFLQAQLEFESLNDPGFTDVPLSGYGRQAKYTVTPTTKDFGEVQIGTGSNPETFTVKPTGQAPIPFYGVTINGADADSFRLLSENCPPMIARTASCDIQVVFDPKFGAATARSATLVVDAFSSVNPGPASIALTGTATAPPAPPGKAKLSLKLMSAKKVKPGKTLLLKATVKNTGNAATTSLSLNTTAPKKLAKTPKTIKLSPLAPGKSITKKIKIRVKKNARKGKKLTVKVVALAGGMATATGDLKVKIN